MSTPGPKCPKYAILARMRSMLFRIVLLSFFSYSSLAIGDAAKPSHSQGGSPVATHSQRANRQCTIALPLREKGCEGECCGVPTDPLVADEDELLFDKPANKAKVVGKITKGEKLKDSELVLITTRLGEVKITAENSAVIELGLKKGDILKTLAYGGEGSYIVCLGSSENGDLGWEGELSQIKPAEVEQWTKVTKKNGLVGYSQGIAYSTRESCN